MRLAPTAKPPCRLAPGETRRVPQDPRLGLVGVHVSCIRCGCVSVVLEGGGQQVSERDGAVVGLAVPLLCRRCGVLIQVEDGEARVKERSDV